MTCLGGKRKLDICPKVDVDQVSQGLARASSTSSRLGRAPEPGSPCTYVTTIAFLSQFGFETPRKLPDLEQLEDAALLSKDRLLASDIPSGIPREGAGESGL